ncbi:hypothetical protein SESBI_18267 [Sesbania bispinosa]|nr:hypothetical protein SESBI_18267 [Sesbania bispinosa]
MEFSRGSRLSRSQRILLSSESVTLECSRITGYERLSQSMRLEGECDFRDDEHKKHKKGMGLLSKVFFFTRISTPKEEDMAVKKKKRSSWLPDPNRRWPIQGW